MMITSESIGILQSLVPMKLRARRKDLMFQHTGMHGEVRLTPEELDQHNAEGRYIWGPPNWELEPKTLAEREREEVVSGYNMASKLMEENKSHIENDLPYKAYIKTDDVWYLCCAFSSKKDAIRYVKAWISVTDSKVMECTESKETIWHKGKAEKDV